LSIAPLQRISIACHRRTHPLRDDDYQRRRPRSRFTFRALRERISNSASCRPERDLATGESGVQKGQMSWRLISATPKLILCRFDNQIREIDEWENDIKEGGKYFFTR
jgi:hypothetical protein